MDQNTLDRLKLLGGDIFSLVREVENLKKENKELAQKMHDLRHELRDQIIEKSVIDNYTKFLNAIYKDRNWDVVSNKIPDLMEVFFKKENHVCPKDMRLSFHLALAYNDCLDEVYVLCDILGQSNLRQNISEEVNSLNATVDGMKQYMDQRFRWIDGRESPHSPMFSELLLNDEVWPHFMKKLKESPRKDIYSILEKHNLSQEKLCEVAEFALIKGNYGKSFLSSNYSRFPSGIQKRILADEDVRKETLPLDVQKLYFAGQPLETLIALSKRYGGYFSNDKDSDIAAIFKFWFEKNK